MTIELQADDVRVAIEALTVREVALERQGRDGEAFDAKTARVKLMSAMTTVEVK